MEVKLCPASKKNRLLKYTSLELLDAIAVSVVIDTCWEGVKC